MEEDWEQIAEKKIIPPPKIPNIDKWDGEDEDDDVKESWEDDEDEKKDEEKPDLKMVKSKPKKSLADKIAEKEAKRLEELQQKLEEESVLTPEEKLRLQKLQEEADLNIGLESLGLNTATGIDAINPTNKADFADLADAISKKVSQYKNNDAYPGFLEDLVRSLCANLNSTDIRKIKTTLDTLQLEKSKIEKEKNKKTKGKAKPGLKSDKSNAPDTANYEGFADYDYDDFM